MATGKRLIDANALMEHLEKCIATTKGLFRSVCTAIKCFVEQMPTVDAVEVVWCGECMWARPKDHREPADTPRQLICQCFKHHHIPAPYTARLAVEPEDFCSYGERRTT